MKTNTPTRPKRTVTHEGAVVTVPSAFKELQRTVMATLLFENTFYESGQSAAQRMHDLVTKLPFEKVAGLAITARNDMHLRHTPLFLARELARQPNLGRKMGDLLVEIIQRPDELAEFLALYWKDNPDAPLSKQVKVGLSRAMRKFNEFQLARYKGEKNAVSLRDVLFLTHSRPNDVTGKRGTTQPAVARENYTRGEVQRHATSVYTRLVAGELAIPETWETMLSAGEDKKATFEHLMLDKKLGGLAFLRNLRNMSEVGVDRALIDTYMDEANFDRVLPFRFLAAARAAPSLEPVIERGMMRCLSGMDKLPGRTVLVVDNSGSMNGPKVSARSDIDRSDAACALAVLLREVCEDCRIISFATSPTEIPPRRGFALIDAIKRSPGGGTNTDTALKMAREIGYDRIIVVTDEQSHQRVSAPLPGARGYFINVANYKNGVGYGPWVHIDGWSEAILTYIQQYEQGLAD